MNNAMKDGINSLLENFNANENPCLSGSLLAGALSHALCLLNRVILKKLPYIEPRVLVIHASNDISAQYIPIMNCVFSCQKRNIIIDSCVLTQTKSLHLMQATYLTKGIYSNPMSLQGLIQHLIMTYLPSNNVRKHLNLPKSLKVDFKASCFCHQTPIDIGYVCPVCLSIFCSQNAICQTCNTKFPRVIVKK